MIDLHRALIREQLPKRWVIKDIAGLYYSAMGIGLTSRDIQRFIWQYSKLNKNFTVRENGEFWNHAAPEVQFCFTFPRNLLYNGVDISDPLGSAIML